ncbi:MAG TPA: LysM domain-containing protein [Candidatus Limnocylindrales bacterium]|nr:LysM domain-containing protein [Candidatus Limnocylindrales bacterium]
MTDRPPGPGDVPMACPFIAFEDDRQRRSTQPDRRHRCYAETPPAPRAISHQETFCLTGNFPACPTFQDWARHEAARSVAGEARSEAPAGRREDALAYLAQTAPEAGRPLWGSGPEQLGAFDALGAEEGRSSTAASGGGAGIGAGGSAGAGSGPGPTGEEPFTDAELADLVRHPRPGGEASRLAGPRGADEGGDDASDDAAGEGGEDDETPAFLAARARGAGALAGAGDDDRGAGLAGPRGSASSAGRSPRPPMAARTPPRPPVDPDAPAWERPRRFEAYPTLRTRTGFGGSSTILVGLVVLVLAAIVLFFLPGLLSGSGQQAGATATPTSPASGASSATPTVPPTIPPPTAQLYTIKAGDTLSAIARRFDTTVDALKAANPQIKDINKIAIGDQITIPTPAPSTSAAESAGATSSAGGGAAGGTSAP